MRMFSLIHLTSSNGVSRASGQLSHESGCSMRAVEDSREGVTGSWNWDGTSFELETDQFGYLPYYYHHDEISGTLLVSDSPQRIASSLGDVSFDPLALGFFARAGFMIGDRSPYEGVKRVPGGSILRWSGAGLSITPLETGACSDVPRTPDDAVDGFIDRFRSAMQSRSGLSEDLVLPLSAGRDSRMMLLALRDLGVLPRELVTIGSSGNADVRIASSLAQALDIPFRRITGGEAGWSDLEQERHRRCGYEALEHVWLIPLWNDLLRGGSAWFDGLGCGSVLRNEVNHPQALSLLRQGRYQEWCEGFFARTAAPPARWVDRIRAVSPVPIADDVDVIDVVRDELERHLEQPNPITSFTFHNWGRRSISLNPLGICREARSIGLPYMDRALVDWSLSIPAEWCFERDIQTEACHRLFPEFRDLPFTISGSANHNAASFVSRIRNRIQKRRFFKNEGGCFRDLHRSGSAASRRDPDFSRAVVLMTHLSLVDKAHVVRESESGSE